MKHVGQILKAYIESHGLLKTQVAKQVGITYNYLSTIYKKESIDAELLERICVAIGLHPAVFFDFPEDAGNTYKDIWAKTMIGNAQVQINENDNLRALLAEKDRVIDEKERTIQILMAQNGLAVPGQNRDNYDK